MISNSVLKDGRNGVISSTGSIPIRNHHPFRSLSLSLPGKPFSLRLWNVKLLQGKRWLWKITFLCSLSRYSKMARDATVFQKKKGPGGMFLKWEGTFPYGPWNQGWWPDGLIHCCQNDEALAFRRSSKPGDGFNYDSQACESRTGSLVNYHADELDACWQTCQWDMGNSNGSSSGSNSRRNV